MARLAELAADPVVQRPQLEIDSLLRFTGGDFIQGSQQTRRPSMPPF